jgi:DNA-binding NarL/FixJ family response regulator
MGANGAAPSGAAPPLASQAKRQFMTQAEPVKAKERRTRVLLVDDHPLVRYGMKQLIEQQADLRVCGEAEDAAGALEAVAQLRPDLALVDLTLRGSSGLELIRNVRTLHPKLPVLVVSMHDEGMYAELAMRAGARGYITKEEAVDKLLIAIRQVLGGKLYLSERMVNRMLQESIRGQTTPQASPAEQLSDRELEVFLLLGQWRTPSEIAAELHLSVKTVGYYQEKIKEKLHLASANELKQFATHWLEQKDHG